MPGSRPVNTEGGEEPLMDVVARYERKGYTGQFGSRAGGRVICFACRRESDAHDVAVVALHRFEGTSDPGEEMAVAALECPLCHSKGTLALAYGPTAPAEDAVVLRRFLDARAESGIRPGV